MKITILSKKIFLLSCLFILLFCGKALAAGSATVSWTAPTTNEDATPITDLAGFVVYYGTTTREGTCPVSITSAAPYDSYVDVADAAAVNQAINNLTEGETYYFTVVAYDTSDNISGCATTDAGGHTEVSKLIPVTPDADAPVLGGGSPSGSLAAGTTQATLAVTTGENATCKYGTVPNTAYASIANDFTTTGTTAHSTTLTGLANGTSYQYLIRCMDVSDNATLSDYAVSFSVASPATSSSSSHSHKKKKKKKKKSSPKRKLSTSPKAVAYGQVLVQSGKKFSKKAQVAVYFSRLNGSYYPPKIVATTATGTFSIASRAIKPRGAYKWYAVDLKTGKRSKTASYKVR